MPSTFPAPSATALLSTLLPLTEHSIIPLTARGVATGSKLFGAAILTSDMQPVTVATNSELTNPLLHGEITCINKFFADHPDLQTRPEVKECIFFATHEPCSLCLSGITWSGFSHIIYLFTYDDSRSLFAIPYDIDILESVFRVPSPHDTEESLSQRPLYNKRNKFFTARSVADLIAEVPTAEEREKWTREAERIQGLYNKLSDTYQKWKADGGQSAAAWK